MIVINNGYSLNIDTIKSILSVIFENKPDFPIDDNDDFVQALGGKDKFFFIDEQIGDVSAISIAERTLKEIDEIAGPTQIIDAIIGDSFVNIMTKVNVLQIIENLNFPIESKESFIDKTKRFTLFGVSVEEIADKLDYPVKNAEPILNQIETSDSKLVNANIDLILDLNQPEHFPEKSEKPTTEAVKKEEKTLNFSVSYLLEVDDPEICYNLQNRAKSKVIETLCISRTHPTQLRDKYQISSGKLLWLTDSDSTQEDTVQPTLESLIFVIESFIQDNPRSLILIDGLEYLISLNNFSSVLKFIQILRDKISEAKSIFLIMISPGVIEGKNLKLITRELEVVDMNCEISLPAGVSTEQTPEEKELEEKITRVVEEGKDAYREKQYERALEIYDHGLALDPDCTEIKFLRNSVQAKLEALNEQTTEKISIEQPESTDKQIDQEFDTQSTEPEMTNRIESLEKRVQDKVKELDNIGEIPKEQPENSCKSCEGTGECYWCKGTGKCAECFGSGKDSNGNECGKCNGTGTCKSCNGAGKCHWCHGTGSKK